MNNFIFIMQQTIIYFVPLMVVALGGLLAERSGVINIALEGTMIIGAFFGLLFLNAYADAIPPQLLLICSLLIASVSGMIFTLPHAFAAIHLKADQIITGTALNMFAVAFCVFTARVVQGVQQITFKNTFRINKIPLLGDIPVIGEILFRKTYITTFVGFALLIAAIIVLSKTRFGVHLRACGENPHAADSVGINVSQMRYAGVLISGALSGLGGLIYVIPSTTSFNSSVSGYGFLALAVLILGQWNPTKILMAALFFGFMKAVSAGYSGIDWLMQYDIPDTVFKMLPFLATLAVLMFTSKHGKGPSSVGKPYDKGSR